MTTEVLITHLSKGYASKLHVIGYDPSKLGDDGAQETVLGTIESGQYLRVLLHGGQALRCTEEVPQT